MKHNHINTLEYETPSGTVLLGSYGNLLCLCEWSKPDTSYPGLRRLCRHLGVDAHNESDAVLEQTCICLEEYFHNQRNMFDDIQTMLTGTAFQNEVWRALTTIPYGKTISYKQLAIQINRPKAVRAVANAIGDNPLAIIIPCHRVIGSNGNLTGYAGGLDVKRSLLEIEKRAYCK